MPAKIKSPYLKAKGRPKKTEKGRKTYDHNGPRLDGWENYSTGMGQLTWDKTVNTLYVRDLRIDDDQLSGLYYGNDIAKIIVNAQLDEAFRVGYEINLPDDPDNSKKDALDVWKPAIDTAVRDLHRWARLFGGAAIYLDLHDGADLTEPLDVKKIKKINSLRVFDRRYVWPLGYDTDPTSPTYWLPEYYGFGGSLAGSLASPRVHHSRLLRAVGLEADRREAQYLFWWGHSVLQPVYTAILRLGLSEQHAVNMMQDATQFVYYIKGLIDAIAAKDAAGIQARYQQIDLARGTNRPLLLDAGTTGSDSEKVEKLITPFTGVYDILTFFQSRVASAAEMPISVLFGTGFHGGLSDKGEGDLRLWYAKVQGYQCREIEPALRRLYAIVGEVLGIDTSQMKFIWRELYEPTAAERALVYFQTAQGDEIYMNAGALRPEEVAISRFGSGKYSQETTIDVDLYRAALMMAPSPGQPAAPTAGPPGTPGQKPPSTEAGNAIGNTGPVRPPAGVAAEGPVTVPEKPELNAGQPPAKPGSQDAPLAAGEVGGSNRITEPQLVDLTGRGTPAKDREPNKLPPDISGITPANTPAQPDKAPSKDTPPATDDTPTAKPASKPASKTGDEIKVKSGDTEIKIKRGK